ncbi:MAG: glycosyltransferase [Actinomycetota bacterium]
MTLTVGSRRTTVSPPLVNPFVVAIVVSHDGEPWLNGALRALRSQFRAPDLVIGVDTGSHDSSAQLLADALGDDHVISVPRSSGYGAAIKQGLTHASVLDQRSTEPQAWIWLIHDDSAPHANALNAQLAEGEGSPSVGVVGAKLVRWDAPDVLLEVGVTVSRGGHRDTGIDGFERDQGQHDHRRDVLAVSSAGMLIRRSVWDLLGGFDPRLPLLRDDIDLCWRAQAAGHRVVLSPDAVVADAQASTRKRRVIHAVSGNVRQVDRRHGIQVAIAHTPLWRVPFLMMWVAVSTLIRSVGLLAAKDPRRAGNDLLATVLALGTPWRWVASRWRSRRLHTVPRSAVTPLLVPRLAPVRHFIALLGAWLVGHDSSPPVAISDVRELTAASHAELHILLRRGRSKFVKFFRHPMTWVSALLTVATGWLWQQTLLRMWTANSLYGGELRDTTAHSDQVWHAAVGGVRGSGFGVSTTGSIAGIAHAGWLRCWEALVGERAGVIGLIVLLIIAVPLAGVTAYWASGIATRSRRIRAWVALAYGGSPLLAGAAANGRIGPVIAGVLLPLMLGLAAQVIRGHPRGPVATLSSAVLVTTAVGLAIPLLAIPVLLMALVMFVGSRRLSIPSGRRRGFVLLVGPLVSLGPWLAELIANPTRLWGGSGAWSDANQDQPDVESNFGFTLPAAWQELLPTHRWAASVVVFSTVVIAGVALSSLFRRGHRGAAVVACGVFGVAGFAWSAAVAVGWLTLGGESAVMPWAGTGFIVSLVAALSAVAIAADGLRGRLTRHGFGWRQAGVALVVLFGLLGPIGGVLAWSWPGTTAVETSDAAGVPAVAEESAQEGFGSRTLVLEADQAQLRYQLYGGEAGTLARGLGDSPQQSPAEVALFAMVKELATGQSSASGVTLQQQMTELAVAFVLVRAPVKESLAQQLDQLGGLTRIGRSADGQLWRVGEDTERAGRVRVVDSSGQFLSSVPIAGPHAAVDTEITSSGNERVLVLAEQESPRWRAFLNGQALRSTQPPGSDSGSWRQAFVLPASGGQLVITHEDSAVAIWQWVQWAGLAVFALMAAPIRRPHVRSQ